VDTGKCTGATAPLEHTARKLASVGEALAAAPPNFPLSPSQARIFSQVNSAIDTSHVVVLYGGSGRGKSTVLSQVRQARGGTFLNARSLFQASALSRHHAQEGPLLGLIEEGFARDDLVLFDDLGAFILEAMMDISYVRASFVATGLQALLDKARGDGKCLLLSTDRLSPAALHDGLSLAPVLDQAALITMPELGLEDYDFIVRHTLAAEFADQLDVAEVFDQASRLSCHQLRLLCSFINKNGRTDSAFIRAIVDERLSSSNIDIANVADIDFDDLKGCDVIKEELLTYVVDPMRHGSKFAELGLKPKRGVLLYGPPGTGKTSIGRVLAREMRGRFFLLDGTLPPEPPGPFYAVLDYFVEEAKRAAPSVLFIDDADVLFNTNRSPGLARYLLSLLDGLESASAGMVTVVLTAMNPGDLPPALLRSGRVELWLQTKVPDWEARAEMLAKELSGAPELEGFSADQVAKLSDGLSAADVRRLAGDVKALYARDILAARQPRTADAYFASAAKIVRRNRKMLEVARGGATRIVPTT
jgi:transitional endoplasmic reticulum ATPase